MLVFAEENFVCVFENQFYLNSDCQNNHWHKKSYQNSFLFRVFGFIIR